MKNTIYCYIKFGVTKIYIVAKYLENKDIIRLHHILYSDNCIDIMKYLLNENFISNVSYKKLIQDIKVNNNSSAISYHDPKEYSIYVDFM